MKRVVICAALLVAACDGDSPPALQGGDSGKDATSVDGTTDTGVDGEADATADVETDAADAADDAADAAVADAGVDGDGAPPPPAPICDPTKTWAGGVKLAPSTSSIDDMSTVTGDETTLAWITPGDAVVHYVDRVDASVAWDPERTLPGTGLAPGQRIAVTRDGNHLYGLGTDLRSFVGFTRSSHADPFVGPTLDLTLSDLNLEGSALAVGETFSDLVVGTSSTSLLLRLAGGSSPGLRLSTRVLPTDTWASTTAFAPQSEFDVVAGKARRPTGLSTDRRALYFFDEASGHEKVGFFDYDAPTASLFVDLGAHANAQPNDDCSVLYYTATDDLYSALKQ